MRCGHPDEYLVLCEEVRGYPIFHEMENGKVLHCVDEYKVDHTGGLRVSCKQCGWSADYSKRRVPVRFKRLLMQLLEHDNNQVFSTK